MACIKVFSLAHNLWGHPGQEVVLVELGCMGEERKVTVTANVGTWCGVRAEDCCL